MSFLFPMVPWGCRVHPALPAWGPKSRAVLLRPILSALVPAGHSAPSSPPDMLGPYSHFHVVHVTLLPVSCRQHCLAGWGHPAHRCSPDPGEFPLGWQQGSTGAPGTQVSPPATPTAPAFLLRPPGWSVRGTELVPKAGARQVLGEGRPQLLRNPTFCTLVGSDSPA